MAIDFNATTTKITTSYTTHNTQRTYSIWAIREGEGEGNLGRYFEKRVAGAQVELLFNQSSADVAFARSTGGIWTCARPTANVWHNIIITYDYGTLSNDPIPYIDGVAQSLTSSTDPSAIADNTDAYVIGNRGSDDARTWDGGLCEFAIWNRILTAAEAASIGADAFSPLFYPASLVFYAPMIRNVFDYKGTGALTETATAVRAHPRIIYPSPAQIRRYTTIAAAGGKTDWPKFQRRGFWNWEF